MSCKHAWWKRVELLNRYRPCASSAFCTEGPFRKWLLGWASSILTLHAWVYVSLAVSWASPQAWSISGCKPVNQAFTNNHFAAITFDWGFSWKYFSFQRKTICSISTELCGMHERIAKLNCIHWSEAFGHTPVQGQWMSTHSPPHSQMSIWECRTLLKLKPTSVSYTLWPMRWFLETQALCWVEACDLLKHGRLISTQSLVVGAVKLKVKLLISLCTWCMWVW